MFGIGSSLQTKGEPKTDLLHGVCGHDTEDDGNAAVQSRIEHSASGTAHDCIEVRRRAPHLTGLNTPSALDNFNLLISPFC